MQCLFALRNQSKIVQVRSHEENPENRVRDQRWPPNWGALRGRLRQRLQLARADSGDDGRRHPGDEREMLEVRNGWIRLETIRGRAALPRDLTVLSGRVGRV